MNYTKPEIAVLGQAARVIEALPGYPGKNDITADDGQGVFKTANPAYDLDE